MKVQLNRSYQYKIVELRNGPKELLGKKCRILLNEEIESILQDSKGFLPGLSAYMLSGLQRGSVVDLPPVKLKYSETRKCHCISYPFPHAPGFGACKADKWERDEETSKKPDLAKVFTKEAL